MQQSQKADLKLIEISFLTGLFLAFVLFYLISFLLTNLKNVLVHKKFFSATVNQIFQSPVFETGVVVVLHMVSINLFITLTFH